MKQSFADHLRTCRYCHAYSTCCLLLQLQKILPDKAETLTVHSFPSRQQKSHNEYATCQVFTQHTTF